MNYEEQVSRRKALCVGATATTLPFTGCLGFLGGPPVGALEVSLVDVRLPNAGLTSATIPFVLEVTNTHGSRSVPTPTIQYDAYIDDKQVATGRETYPTLGSGDTANEEVEFNVSYAEVGGAIADVIRNEQFTLELRGEAESNGESTTWSDQYQF